MINELKSKPDPLQIKQKIKEILIEQELRRRKSLKRELEAQGLAAQKAEQIEKERKRKAEEDKLWEETREQRVNNWRDFQTKKNSNNSTKILLKSLTYSSYGFIKTISAASSSE